MKKRSKAVIAVSVALITLVIIVMGAPVKIEGEAMGFEYSDSDNRAFIGLNGENNTFNFTPCFLYSSFETGTYELSGLNLELKCDSGNHFSFLRIGKYLIFLQGRSSDVGRLKFRPEQVDGKKVIRNLGVFVLSER